MKLRTKDEIITCLIDSLSVDTNKGISLDEGYIHEGWIEALKWVLGLSDEEKKVFIEGKNTLVVEERETNEI